MYLIKVGYRYINFNHVSYVETLNYIEEPIKVRIYVADEVIDIKEPDASALLKFLDTQCLYRDGEESMKQPPTSDPHSDPASLN